MVQPPPTAPSAQVAEAASTATSTQTKVAATTRTMTPAEQAVGTAGTASTTIGRELISELAQSSLARMKSILRLEPSHYSDVLQVNRCACACHAYTMRMPPLHHAHGYAMHAPCTCAG